MGFDLGDGPPDDGRPLRRGWTTGACATAATKAALAALLTGEFPDPVEIELPKGGRPAFPLARQRLDRNEASAAIVKDAGDDPDVTHLAEISAAVRFGEPGSGVLFRAGEGVGTVTLPGLPIPPGEPAINPVPRAMMREAAEALCRLHGRAADVEITVSVANGRELARNTWNGRLGIVGGLSILGTTGIVHPFSCSAWIHSIHRGVDVARAAGLAHVVGSTGSSSEDAARRLHPDLAETAFLDMGDFAGGLLKYLRAHPVPRLTLAGGFAKLAKLGDGAMDLHSGRSQVDFEFLLGLAERLDPAAAARLAAGIRGANTAKAALDLATGEGVDLGRAVAEAALTTVRDVLRGAPVETDILVVDRAGAVVGRAG
jgi:cobalt-precorrin-5B (C1)-methyltransferase